ncbi:MAG TPA: hypothetical protein VFJ95_01035 [Gammaproteobacteria bacterium]|jgi:hypothetical protein|nr:hypothetical protein [Gammaproteobacteria bacterium]
MRTEHDMVFELLDPPPGGVERMRARFAEPEMRAAGFGLAAFGVTALVVLAALLVYQPPESSSSGPIYNAIAASPELDRLLGRETAPVPLTVKRDDEPARIEELPSSDPQVRIYRVL